MATYSVNNDSTTYNLPDEGTIFRNSGDINQDSVYQIKNGQLSTLAGRTQVAATDLRAPDGSIIKAGSSVPTDRLIDAGYKVVDPNFRGGWSYSTSGGQNYASQTGTDYNSLAAFNLGDIQTVLSRNNGMLPATSKSEAFDPAIQGYTNPNAAMQVPQAQPTAATQVAQPSPFGANYGSLGGTNTLQQPATQPGQQAPNTQATGKAPLTFNGSIVDLLNSASVDSSYAARAQMAANLGIQNYSGTAEQNKTLAKKFLDSYNSVKGTTAPQTGSEARTILNNLSQAQDQVQDPQAQFFDKFGSLTPVENQLFTQISQLMNTQANQQSLVDLYKQEVAAQGIPELNLQLADINKIINGTESDIRQEVEKSGGFATESQILALSSVRNKVLLQNAQYLTDVINSKSDYVDHIVQLTGADRNAVSDQIDQKLGIAKTVFDMTQKMQDNAKEGYQSVIDQIGWQGLAQSVAGNPAQAANIEQAFGLAPGELASLASYKAPLTALQQLQIDNQKLQNQKLQQDLAKIPAGQITPTQNALVIAQQQQTIADTSSLVKDPGLNSAVGPNFLARIAVADAFGAKSNFIASVEQLRQQLTLDKLVAAKGSGATFGALSDSELQLLSASASKLGTWAIKDNAGNVTGYNIDEGSFKAELDKINNFQKLGYILKGGAPSAVNVQQQSDGSYWTQNSDGSYAKLQ